jgi:hypothetical protein
VAVIVRDLYGGAETFEDAGEDLLVAAAADVDIGPVVPAAPEADE